MRIEPSYSEAFTWYKLRRAVYRILLREVGNGKRVLEVGCGVGTNIRMLNKLLPASMDVEFQGVDISPKAIQEAAEYSKKEGIRKAFFEVGKAEDLKYDAGVFDIVICTEVLEHLPGPKVAISEMYRVLKKGGCAIITTPNGTNVFRRLVGKRIKKRLESEVEILDPHELRDDSYGHISVLGSRELLRMSRETGFKIEHICKESMVHGGPIFDRHQVLFAIILIVDSILDRIPYTYSFSWGVVLKLRKK